MKLLVAVVFLAMLALASASSSTSDTSPESVVNPRCVVFYERLSVDALAKLVSVCSKTRSPWFCECFTNVQVS